MKQDGCLTILTLEGTTVMSRGISQKNGRFSVNDSVWVAAAVISYEKYHKDGCRHIIEFTLSQRDIRNRAKEIIEANVEAARTSQWCCGDHENHTHPYLRKIGEAARRLAFPEEFGGGEVPSGLNESDSLTTSAGIITVKQLIDFVNKEYKALEVGGVHISKVVEGNSIFYPSIEDYDPGITADEYERILSDESIVKKSWLDILVFLYRMGGVGTCKQIANRYGKGAPHYNTNGINIAKAVAKATGCPLNTRETGENCYWPVLFLGKEMPAKSEDGIFCYKMREPLMEAIKAMEERGEFQEMKESVEFDKNIILYGPPGTGKTYNTAIYAVAICDDKPLEEIAALDYDVVMARHKELKEAGRIAFTTFHQSYGYEEFIEGIKPVMNDEDKSGNIKYSIEDGVFKHFCKEGERIDDESKNRVFIIDEINRGNISKIFGELITLIEGSKRKGMPEAASAILPYSGKEFSVPANVYILGTMNTADRSIALMDTALRRRFQFVEMMPNSGVLKGITVDGLNIASMLDIINKRIEFLYDREHTVGHAFFIALKENPTVECLASIFSKSVIPLLQEYFYEDFQKIQLVLGDTGKKEDESNLKFIKDIKVVEKDIFVGRVEDTIDLPEKSYSINPEAFMNIESYKRIAPGL